MIRAVLFDAGNTILRAEPEVAVRYAKTAQKYGVNIKPEQIKERFVPLWRDFEERRRRALFKTDKEGTKRFWYEFVSEVFAPWQNEFSDFEAFFEELYFAFASPNAWRLFDDTMPVLTKLKQQGYLLGLVSNWDYRLNQIIDFFGLRKLFDTVVISAELGFEKPAPQIFNAALEKLDCYPEETIHIGDSLTDDVEGALKSGINAALLVRPPHEPPLNQSRFFVIRSLFEVFTIIKQQKASLNTR